MSPDESHRMQEIYRREYRSLLQYVREASPYTSRADRSLRDSVMRIANEESSSLESFGEVLESLRVSIPYLGSFPVGFTDLNFVTIRHLLPKLVAEQKRDLVTIEAEIPACAGAIAHAAVQRLADLHRRHLIELEALG
jgi:hypothetical protein